MADVIRRRERGQLILVTGLLIAVTMVALVLLLNASIYTENLASRGQDQSGREAIEYHSTVVGSTGRLIDAENAREHGTYVAVKSNVTSEIGTIDDRTARYHAIEGAVVRIDQSPGSLVVTQGRLVRQLNSSRPFENESGAPGDWQVASNVEHVRAVGFTVQRSSLSSSPSGAFAVHLNDSVHTWTVYLYTDGTNVTLATSVDGGSVSDVCSSVGSRVSVDLTAGTIAGDPCSGYQWAEGLSGGYDLEFQQGQRAVGTYNLTVDSTGGAAVDSANVHDGPSSTVYSVPAVYSTTFDLSYRTATLTYRDRVRIAPGEPR